MSSTTPTGSWRMKRVKPGEGGSRSSASASGAIDIMCRARRSAVFTSPRACARGFPICRVLSLALRSPSPSNAAQKRSAGPAALGPGSTGQDVLDLAWQEELALRDDLSAVGVVDAEGARHGAILRPG